MVEKSGRLRLLDILRGFAVMGTLGTNIWLFAYLGDLNYILTFNVDAWWTSFQEFVRVFVLFLVNGKLLGLLTIMFGVGLEMKYQQSLRRGNTWPGVYIWTSVILMVEGFIHFALVMEYDILMSYGITAIITAFIIKGGDKAIRRAMKIVGGFHGTVMLLLLIGGIYLGMSGANVNVGDMQGTMLLYKDGSWLQQVEYRLSHFLMLRTEVLFVIPMNIFLFLLGIRLMRSGYFAADEDGRKKRRKLLQWGLCLGIPLNLLIFVPGGYFDLPVRYLFAPILALGYIGLLAKLVESSEKLWLWNRLEQVGKMSLSCYVLQNIISGVIFYGWGLGLGGKLNPAAVAGVWIAISCVQMLFAYLWLGRFKLGPMESARRFATSLVAKPRN
ncbi:DUF418 domain-containing protein [Paenibacillus sp. 1011MAR3C5]|uniref:DUF418 domain-containing protein n=1 Tax=Paenibacillus sp. 1011MAR3C5 TaxID=1675787 RepID=UPI000E6CC346|nr:DUF418 domain-containing protein [Paenibacillus sp. 1011MAR3C5]RJE88415.1 DUF418 domain-containing protein [Paenibacillus sp. 1011MAR3C5]